MCSFSDPSLSAPLIHQNHVAINVDNFDKTYIFHTHESLLLFPRFINGLCNTWQFGKVLRLMGQLTTYSAFWCSNDLFSSWFHQVEPSSWPVSFTVLLNRLLLSSDQHGLGNDDHWENKNGTWSSGNFEVGLSIWCNFEIVSGNLYYLSHFNPNWFTHSFLSCRRANWWSLTQHEYLVMSCRSQVEEVWITRNMRINWIIKAASASPAWIVALQDTYISFVILSSSFNSRTRVNLCSYMSYPEEYFFSSFLLQMKINRIQPEGKEQTASQVTI